MAVNSQWWCLCKPFFDVRKFVNNNGKTLLKRKSERRQSANLLAFPCVFDKSGECRKEDLPWEFRRSSCCIFLTWGGSQRIEQSKGPLTQHAGYNARYACVKMDGTAEHASALSLPAAAYTVPTSNLKLPNSLLERMKVLDWRTYRNFMGKNPRHSVQYFVINSWWTVKPTCTTLTIPNKRPKQRLSEQARLLGLELFREQQRRKHFNRNKQTWCSHLPIWKKSHITVSQTQ